MIATHHSIQAYHCKHVASMAMEAGKHRETSIICLVRAMAGATYGLSFLHVPCSKSPIMLLIGCITLIGSTKSAICG